MPMTDCPTHERLLATHRDALHMLHQRSEEGPQDGDLGGVTLSRRMAAKMPSQPPTQNTTFESMSGFAFGDADDSA